jgi:ferredoxin--NADP+ reductase
VLGLPTPALSGTETLDTQALAGKPPLAPPESPPVAPSGGGPVVFGSPQPPAVRAGDHAQPPVAHKRLVRRAYSIASSPLVRDYVELLVVLVVAGELTPRLWDIPVGGRVWMDPKISGRFTLRQRADCDAVMVGTGTGVAPFVSMLRTFHIARASPADRARYWRRCVLIHGVRNLSDLAYRAEIEVICREDPTVIYIPTVTRETPGSAWAGLRGRVQAVLEDATYQRLVGTALDPAAAQVYLCGNPAMIKEVEAMLSGRGFALDARGKAGNLHFERYW